MAELNMDCVRDLLLYLEENMRYRESGRVVPVKMKHIRHQMEGCSYEDLCEAAKYILESGLVSVEDPKGSIPSKYVFTGITPKGHELIQAIRDGTTWNKVKEQIPSLFKQGISGALKILIGICP